MIKIASKAGQRQARKEKIKKERKRKERKKKGKRRKRKKKGEPKQAPHRGCWACRPAEQFPGSQPETPPDLARPR